MGFTVISKESVGMHRVYDIVLDQYHNFFANGICVHNCSDPMMES